MDRPESPDLGGKYLTCKLETYKEEQREERRSKTEKIAGNRRKKCHH